MPRVDCARLLFVRSPPHPCHGKVLLRGIQHPCVLRTVGQRPHGDRTNDDCRYTLDDEEKLPISHGRMHLLNPERDEARERAPDGRKALVACEPKAYFPLKRLKGTEGDRDDATLV